MCVSRAQLEAGARELPRAGYALPTGTAAVGGEWCYCVEIKPPVVTTIQRLPQRVTNRSVPPLAHSLLALLLEPSNRR